MKESTWDLTYEANRCSNDITKQCTCNINLYNK